MEKSLKYYAFCWTIVLAAFNVITFAVPITVNVNKFTQSFWIGYASITLMFIAQLACSIVFLSKTVTKKDFLIFPLSL